MRREHIKLDLYPKYPPLDKTNEGQRATHPTPADFKAAAEQILTYGQLALYQQCNHYNTRIVLALHCTAKGTPSFYYMHSKNGLN
ncbi:hypothetical protein PGT21_031120 [Puccinia graminis f. sp. tritici]|uniref:Uncharacterized protein n=1 Tax=Puccinia graminis f. sp. tritici TaxID=56615 RepID=A0A5B0M1C9_PUCGR|nr:hypothetical protein PGT21_032887 [Puccinia graminis f. sp. tritici]KAA1104748.1 hypothetical protein PGT21_031120 [Puccinia graminis f. sp. tritici]